jgi:hypothetical protein
MDCSLLECRSRFRCGIQLAVHSKGIWSENGSDVNPEFFRAIFQRLDTMRIVELYRFRDTDPISGKSSCTKRVLREADAASH